VSNEINCTTIAKKNTIPRQWTATKAIDPFRSLPSCRLSRQAIAISITGHLRVAQFDSVRFDLVPPTIVPSRSSSIFLAICLICTAPHQYPQARPDASIMNLFLTIFFVLLNPQSSRRPLPHGWKVFLGSPTKELVSTHPSRSTQ
jgi:hypothetical protein